MKRGAPMKTVRRIDELGRIVIPKDMRKALDIDNPGESVGISVQDDKIILRKYNPGCIFCGEDENLSDFNGHKICKKCVDKISKI